MGRPCGGSLAAEDVGLVLQEPELAVETPAIAAQRARRGDHPMAGNDDADRVPSIGAADRAAGAGVADPPGEFTRTTTVGDKVKVERNRMRLTNGEHDHVWRDEQPVATEDAEADA